MPAAAISENRLRRAPAIPVVSPLSSQIAGLADGLEAKMGEEIAKLKKALRKQERDHAALQSLYKTANDKIDALSQGYKKIKDERDKEVAMRNVVLADHEPLRREFVKLKGEYELVVKTNYADLVKAHDELDLMRRAKEVNDKWRADAAFRETNLLNERTALKKELEYLNRVLAERQHLKWDDHAAETVRQFAKNGETVSETFRRIGAENVALGDLELQNAELRDRIKLLERHEAQYKKFLGGILSATEALNRGES